MLHSDAVQIVACWASIESVRNSCSPPQHAAAAKCAPRRMRKTARAAAVACASTRPRAHVGKHVQNMSNLVWMVASVRFLPCCTHVRQQDTDFVDTTHETNFGMIELIKTRNHHRRWPCVEFLLKKSHRLEPMASSRWLFSGKSRLPRRLSASPGSCSGKPARPRGTRPAPRASTAAAPATPYVGMN